MGYPPLSTPSSVYMPVLFFKHCHSVESTDSISVDTDPTDTIRKFDPGKYCLLYL